MKGMVFTELLSMAETVMGEEAVDQILDDLDLESGAAYNAVGNYPCSELFTLVEAFGAHLNMPLDQLQRQFGAWMFGHFAKNYPVFFEGKADALAMLDAIENEVHCGGAQTLPQCGAAKLRDRTSGGKRVADDLSLRTPLDRLFVMD